MKRAIVVDDELPAVRKLSRMLAETGLVEIAATFTDPAQAAAFLQDQYVDLAFLDIEMPAMDGFELADRLLKLCGGVHIIFVTAFSEYAVEAFRVNALDYLLKPVDRERLDLALSRVPDLSKNVADTAAKPVQVTCFGKFGVTIGGEYLKFRTAKAEELFAYMVDNNGKPVSRNYIIDTFWTDYDGDRGLILFNTTLYYLKKAFMDRGVQLDIDYSRGSYRLNIQKFACDAIAFENKLSAQKSVSAANIGEYERLLAGYKGDYMEHNDYDWAVQRRISLKEKYAGLLLLVSNYYLAAGQPQKAVELLKEGLIKDPLNRLLNYELLRELKSSNDTVSLLKYYEIYSRRLKKELSEEPDTECRTLVQCHLK